MKYSTKILNICRFDVHAGLNLNYRSAGYGKQCLLAWSCVEERGWLRLKKSIRFFRLKVKGRREAEEDMEKAGRGRKYEGWIKKER